MAPKSSLPHFLRLWEELSVRWDGRLRSARGVLSQYRWVVLGVGTAAQASTAAFFLGLAAVTPDLRAFSPGWPGSAR